MLKTFRNFVKPFLQFWLLGLGTSPTIYIHMNTFVQPLWNVKDADCPKTRWEV